MNRKKEKRKKERKKKRKEERKKEKKKKERKEERKTEIKKARLDIRKKEGLRYCLSPLLFKRLKKNILAISFNQSDCKFRTRLGRQSYFTRDKTSGSLPNLVYKHTKFCGYQ